MAKSRVKLAFVSNYLARKVAYMRRKKALFEKVRELSILYGISACVVISNPFNSKSEVWPNLEGAEQVLKSYQNSSMTDETNDMNEESLLLQKIVEAKENLKKLKQDNHEKKLDLLMTLELRKEIDDKVVALNLSN